MTKSIIHSIICIILFCTCNSDNLTKTESKNIKVNHIRHLISNIGFVNLPIAIDAHSKNSLTSVYKVNFNGPDTLVFDKDIYSVVGFLPDTSDYYAFLFHTIGDMLYPTIMTINKGGNKIDRQIICAGGCAGHGALEVTSCYDSVRVNKDLKIASTSRVIGTIEREDTIPRILNVCNKIILTGQINKDGHIELKESGLLNCDEK